MPCTGKGGTGSCSKSCTVFLPKKPGKDDSKCKNCSHRKKSHIEDSISDVLQRHGLSKLKPVTDSDARKETNAGFRPKEASVSKHKVTKQKQSPADPSHLVKIDSVLVIPVGTDEEGDLRIAQAPTGSQVEKLLKYKLAAFKTRDGKIIEFDPDWSQKRIDKWFRELLPLLFELLDLRHPEDAPPRFHWVLVKKEQRALFVMERETITGAELDQAKGSKGRPYSEYSIRIATKHRLPSAVYKNLNDAIENFNADDVVSESEVDERPDNNPKKSRCKPRTRALKSAPIIQADTTSEESSDDELEDLDEVVEVTPPHRTRSSVKVKQESTEPREALFLREFDSDAEEHFPPPHEAFVLGTSLKRSASSFGFDDNKGKSKKIRSTSITSHISVNSTDDGTNQDSPSPRLRPVTSSFQYQYDPALDPTSVTSSKYSTWTPSWTSTPITSTSSSSATGNAFASTSSAGSSTAGATASSSQVPAPVSHSARRSGFSGHTVQRHVPGPPREGLTIPESADNPWA